MTPEQFNAYAKAYVHALETLSYSALDEFFDLTTTDIEFRDPFNHTRGQAAMRMVFIDMFEKLDDVSFEVHGHAGDLSERLLYIHWTFRAQNKWTGQMSFQGMSRVKMSDEGLIASHLDYWDAGEELYGRIPVLGTLIRRIRARLRVPEGQI